MSKTIAEHAYEYLKEQDFDWVMWGDAHQLHAIQERAGRPHRSWKTEKSVLQALERSPLFVKAFTQLGNGRHVRMFWRHDAAPERLKSQ